MALHIPKAPGFSSMLKDGARHYSGLEEAVFRNIAACKEFSKTLKTAYGPQGRNKMVINHLEKLFVTNDAATIIKELEIEHPAAKLMVLASQMQEQEMGDGTNWVIMFAGALLEAAEDLLRMGLTPTDLAEGYQLALNKALEVLPSLKCWEVSDPRDLDQVTKALRSTIMSKQFGNEDFLAKLVARACISILPEKTTFNVDNVRICKILGSGVQTSEVVKGMVFRRTVEGAVTSKEKAKLAVYSCPFDVTTTETKGTVLIKTADELANFSRGEENKMEDDVKALSEAGITVVVAGGKIGDLALHYLNKYKIMAVRIVSKWDLRRLCKTVGATILPKLTCPTPEEIGLCDNVFMDEVGDTPVTIFRQDGEESRITTIVIRGSTDNYMDDIERAVDDAVNTFKGLCRDGSFVAGAGSTEIELSRLVEQYGSQCPGLEQYAIKKFAEALRVFPKVLADNCGASDQETLSNLLAAHTEGKTNAGFDCEGNGSNVIDASEKEIYDLYLTKYWALKYATSAANQILRVDQIIMAKRAGGPKSRGMGPQDPDDD
ncbi:T-complex protein 1 subunit theta-like [Homarus americanus]|uniref:T-complex protein 1 subunit theta-like n=1 Tax=Homarus americanus TaxID=6706 RepID=UPI001C4703C7|nr:T-complex protein 1 subunit theta-like [Homarus americanus]XP_042210555.1 T-complex protein 1 subunit theta-like [Homarus americanus]